MLQSSYPLVESVLPGAREGLYMQETSGLHPGNTKDCFIYFETVSVRRRCGHTSSCRGQERRYHPLNWSCTSKQHCRDRHLSYLRMRRRLSSKCSQSYLRMRRRLSSKCSPITLTVKPGKEYGEYLALYASPRSGHSETVVFVSRYVRPRSKR